MSDHREIDPEPTAPARPALPWGGLVASIPARKFSARAKLAMIVMAALLAWAVAQGVLFARSWLALHPDHTLSLTQVELLPPPPAELRGGAPALLIRLRDASGHVGPIHLLDQDLGEIADLFKVHCPWVEKVKRVERRPSNRLIVDLEYRKPLARLDFRKGEAIALDAGTHVLPIADLTPESAERLISIRGIVPSGARPGLPLETEKAAHLPSRTDPDALAAVHLAGILMPEVEKAKIPRVAVCLFDDSRRFYLRAEKGFYIWWGDAPGEESVGHPSATEKLDRLKEWAPRLVGKKYSPDEYLDLTLPSGAEIRPGIRR